MAHAEASQNPNLISGIMPIYPQLVVEGTGAPKALEYTVGSNGIPFIQIPNHQIGNDWGIYSRPGTAVLSPVANGWCLETLRAYNGADHYTASLQKRWADIGKSSIVADFSWGVDGGEISQTLSGVFYDKDGNGEGLTCIRKDGIFDMFDVGFTVGETGSTSKFRFDKDGNLIDVMLVDPSFTEHNSFVSPILRRLKEDGPKFMIHVTKDDLAKSQLALAALRRVYGADHHHEHLPRLDLDRTFAAVTKAMSDNHHAKIASLLSLR